MADIDLAKVKRNVAKMAAMNAPVEDIDGYIASEGATVEAVRSFRPGPSGIAADDPRMEFIRKAKENVANGIRPKAGPDHSEVGERFGGIGMNATAGANSALYSTLGAPVDLMRGGMNLGIRGINAATGADIGMIPEDSFGGARSIGGMMGAVAPQLDPQNTTAATTEERIARGIGEGAGYAMAPEAALAGLVRSGAVGGRAADMAGQMFGRAASTGAVAGNAAVGAASGGGASAAMEAAPDEYKPIAGLVGGMAAGGGAVLAAGVPGAVRAGGQMAGDYIAPMTQAGRERLASERLRSGATDVAAVRETLDNLPNELVPGSAPTTGQVTGDLGLLGLERGAQVKSPEPFAQRRADQNEARVGALGGIQQGGAPEKVADALRSRLKQIDDEADRIIAEAQRGAQERAGALGQGMDPSTAGDRLRGSLETARTAAKEQERALWSAVDPDGTLVLPTSGMREHLAKERSGRTISAKPPTEEEAAIYDVLDRYGEAMPFREVADLQSRVKSAMRAERMANGESMSYARMSRLHGAIQKDLEQATAIKVQQEERAVAAGEMSVDDTMLARFAAKRDTWFADRQTTARSADGGGGPGGYAGTGSIAVPGVSGAGGQARGRPSGAPSDPRLPSGELQPNFDPDALGRLTAARTATRERVQIFDNKTLGPIRRRPATNAPYDVASADVARRIFFPQPKSADTIRQFRQAVGDAEALPVLRDYAVDRLRRVALRDDGTFDPAKLDAWRRGHADALRAFPDLDRSLADASRAAETLGAVQRQRTTAMANAQKGSLGRLLQIDAPEDVTRTVGAMFNAQDGVNRLMRLRQAIGTNKEARQGLRQAVADHIRLQFIGNTEAGVSGIGTMKADAFQTFVRKNTAALKVAGFTDDEVKTMQAIADDLQRANRSVSAVRNPGGSDSAQNLYAAAGKEQPTLLRSIIASLPGAAAGAGGLMMSGPVAGFVGYIGAKSLGNMRAAGISSVDDLVADALLNPARAKLLLTTPSRQTREPTLKLLGEMYRRSAAVSGASSMDGEGSGTEKRQPVRIDVTRATGGSR